MQHKKGVIVIIMTSFCCKNMANTKLSNVTKNTLAG